MLGSKCKEFYTDIWWIFYKSAYYGLGRNPSFPNVIDDQLPAMEDDVLSQTLASNINAMNSARQAFVKCEASNKIRKALKSQVRTCNDEYFHNGEKVMFNCLKGKIL